MVKNAWAQLLLVLVYTLGVASWRVQRIPSKQIRSWRLSLSSQQPSKLSVYNSQTREKQEFVPLSTGAVKFYSCGPTVYDYAHVGNFRAFLTYDLVKRWLRFCGYQVHHVCNLTDIDDKIIARMGRERLSLEALTSKYADAFFEDLQLLNVLPANEYPRATQYIGRILTMIEGLVAKGFAYESKGSVYYRVNAFPRYGQFAHIDFCGQQDASTPTDDKEDGKDFALWKAYKDEDGDVWWDSSFGRGRPGWHIECSAMCTQLLGDTIDIHAGGVDLIFPHHQNEVAQSEAFTGQEFCRYWIHNGFVNIDNEKMSKSLGNFRTLRDVVSSAADVRAFRYFVVSAQYRAPLNFTPDTISVAAKSVARLDKLMASLRDRLADAEAAQVKDCAGFENRCTQCIEQFTVAMNDDLNTPRAVAAIFGLAKEAERALKRKELSAKDAQAALGCLHRLDEVLGIFYEVPRVGALDQPSQKSSLVADVQQQLVKLEQAPKAVADIAVRRFDHKQRAEYAEADQLRAELTSLGYIVKDRKDGFDLYRVG